MFPLSATISAAAPLPYHPTSRFANTRREYPCGALAQAAATVKAAASIPHRESGKSSSINMEL